MFTRATPQKSEASGAEILENDTETKKEDKKEQSDFEELNALTKLKVRMSLARQTDMKRS